MEKDVIDRIFQEELEKWHLQDRGWIWRFGYPKMFSNHYADSYTDFDLKRITISKDTKNRFGARINLRHQFYHAFCCENNLEHSEFFAYVAELSPFLPKKILFRRLARREKLENKVEKEEEREKNQNFLRVKSST